MSILCCPRDSSATSGARLRRGAAWAAAEADVAFAVAAVGRVLTTILRTRRELAFAGEDGDGDEDGLARLVPLKEAAAAAAMPFALLPGAFPPSSFPAAILAARREARPRD